MGVPGVLSFVTYGKNNLLSWIDVVQEAKNLGEIRILVDYDSFTMKLLRLASERLSCIANTKNICLTGIDFKYLSDFVIAYYRAFLTANIKLEFYVGTARGASSNEHFEHMYSEYVSRWNNNRRRNEHLIIVANGLESPCYPEDYEFIRSPLVNNIILTTLRDTGAKVTICSRGNTNLTIARQCSESNNSYILSNDSDFCLIKGCRFIPIKILDGSEVYLFDGNNCLPRTPKTFLVGVINADDLFIKLGLRDNKQLIDIAVTCGTRHTKRFVDGLHMCYLRCNHWFSEVLLYYKRNDCYFETTPFFSFALKHKEFLAAVEYSRKFYALDQNLFMSFENLTHYHQNLIHAVEKGNLDSRALAIFHKNLWQREFFYSIMETVYPDIYFQKLNDAFAEMIHGEKVEYNVYIVKCNSCSPPECQCRIATSKGLPNVLKCNQLTLEERKKLQFDIFDVSISMQMNNYQDQLIVLIVRFLKMQFEYFHTGINDNEIIAITLSIFPDDVPNEAVLQLYELRPTTRCIHFRAVVEFAIWYAYVFIGAALSLQKSFGPISSLFSPVIFNALFMLASEGLRNAPEVTNICTNILDSQLGKRKHLISAIQQKH